MWTVQVILALSTFLLCYGVPTGRFVAEDNPIIQTSVRSEHAGFVQFGSQVFDGIREDIDAWKRRMKGCRIVRTHSRSSWCETYVKSTEDGEHDLEIPESFERDEIELEMVQTAADYENAQVTIIMSDFFNNEEGFVTISGVDNRPYSARVKFESKSQQRTKNLRTALAILKKRGFSSSAFDLSLVQVKQTADFGNGRRRYLVVFHFSEQYRKELGTS